MPAGGDGFELRLGYHDLAALNPPGTVAGEYLTLGVMMADELEARPQG